MSNLRPLADPWKSKPPCSRDRKGTKELQRQYGDKLVCVSYRYDAKRRKRMKTIELIVEEKDLILIDTPALSAQVLVDVGYQETELRAQVKAAGGFWDPAAKAWKLTWQKVLEIGLERRVRKTGEK